MNPKTYMIPKLFVIPKYCKYCSDDLSMLALAIVEPEGGFPPVCHRTKCRAKWNAENHKQSD